MSAAPCASVVKRWISGLGPLISAHLLELVEEGHLVLGESYFWVAHDLSLENIILTKV